MSDDINETISTIVIVGGGSAGWLTAGLLASELGAGRDNAKRITLVESPDTSPIGVGEGTWPSMRKTLAKIGVSENEFFKHCEASFKQGAKFAKWKTGAEDDFYYHPLVLPIGFGEVDLVAPWSLQGSGKRFSETVCFQDDLCERGLAPKMITHPEYAAVANYAYHLNSNKLGEFLREHCVKNLNIQHLIGHVESVCSRENGDIESLVLNSGETIAGDLFVDCSGMASILLGRHYKTPFRSRKHVLFNDRAVAVQVPYVCADDPIASHTISTAQSAGWIWDIGLPTRKGVGYVYSSAHAEEHTILDDLQTYVAASVGKERAESLEYRSLSFDPGHREIFWQNNCVAVGMANGFIEPLEASALVLVEAAAGMIAKDMPQTRSVMPIVAKRFNERMHYYWDTIVDFLKLHYVLSDRRDSDYWRDNVDESAIPDSLRERLCLWRQQVPNQFDFPLAEEMFPAASWQYVLYGMEFKTDFDRHPRNIKKGEIALAKFQEVRQFSQRCINQLPPNRELINKIYKYGFQAI